MISVSLLSAYSYCPRKIFLTSVLKYYEAPKESTVKGTIHHEAFDSLNQNEREIVVAIAPGDTLEIVHESYRQMLSKRVRGSIIRYRSMIEKAGLEPSAIYDQTMKHLSDEILIRAKNVFLFMQQKGIFGEELWDELTPKIKSEYRVSSEELGLIGVVDQIKIMKGTVLPVELKTGSAPKEGVWPNHRLQISAYIMLLEEQLNINLGKGIVRYLGVDEEREFILNPYARQEVIDTKIKVERLLSGLELPEREKNENKCERCGLKKVCFDDALLKCRLEELSLAEKRKI